MKIQTQILSYLILFFMTVSTVSFANKDLVPEVLILRSTESFGIVYTHSLKKNQTVYGLAKFFNTEINQISAANPGVKLNAIKLNQQVNVPINTSMIKAAKKDKFSTHYIPVFYTVKAKDNLFRVAKVYFNQQIETVMKINNLQSMELNVGQKLLVGWYQYDPSYENKLAWDIKGIEVNANSMGTSTNNDTPPAFVPVKQKRQLVKKEDDQSKPVFQKVISSRNEVPVVSDIDIAEIPIKESVQTTKTQTVVNEKTELTDEIVAEVESINEEEITEELVLSSDPFENRNGIYKGEYSDKPLINKKKIRAQWNSKSKDKVNLFALHATAKKNSYIEIYNPMQDRKVIAKVVGNIPSKIHKKNVDLIVSPKVADTLGVMDKKFFVTIRYIE